MAALVDIARFLPEDPDPLVQAAFACPCCLHAPTFVGISFQSEGSALARCTCSPCDHEWAVGLDPAQSLRIQLQPPWTEMHSIVRVRG